MVNCPECGWVPVPEDQLPVVLPEVEKYQPTDTGEFPLANIREWVETTCPRCGGPLAGKPTPCPIGPAAIGTSCAIPTRTIRPLWPDMEKMRYWMPVDVYMGGDEHNTLHLLYSRFIYLFLYDLGYVPREIPEPYQKRMSHGVILGPDGARMSKIHRQRDRAG